MGEDARVEGDHVVGLGLDYSAITRALYHLARDGSITAEFVLEQPGASELFGPIRKQGRRETE